MGLAPGSETVESTVTGLVGTGVVIVCNGAGEVTDGIVNENDLVAKLVVTTLAPGRTSGSFIGVNSLEKFRVLTLLCGSFRLIPLLLT